MEDLTLHTKKITPIEFELAVEGLKNDPTAVRFIVENPDYDVALTCKKDSNNKWSVSVPPLAEQKGKQYKYRIEVIVDGLFFEPVKGGIILQSGEPTVKVEMKNDQINEEKKPVAAPRTPKKPKPEKTVIKESKTVERTEKKVDIDTKLPPVVKTELPVDKPIPPLAESVSVGDDNSTIPSLKAKIVENEKKKDPKYLEEREKKVRAVLDQIK
jgi:hypothetical protein